MIDEIKELRIKIDGLSQLVKEIKLIKVKWITEIDNGFIVSYKSLPILDKITKYNSSEINKCYDSLILAKAWLGKVLQELGDKTPYVNEGKRKDIKDIEPVADSRGRKHDLIFFEEVGDYDKYWKDTPYIEKIDWLREEIKNLITLSKDITEKIEFDTDISSEDFRLPLYSVNAENYLIEARFWLGFELGRIRDNKQ